MKLSLLVVGVCLVATQAGGCETERAPSAPVPGPPAVQRGPTPERPIVVAFDEPKTLLVFGGPDGTERSRFPRPEGFLGYRFSPSGRRAAVLSAPDRRNVRLAVYDESGEALVRAEFPPPGEGFANGRVWASDAAEALVLVETWLPVAQPARESGTHVDPDAPAPEPTGVRCWFVRPGGATVELGDHRPREACFPRQPGVAYLTANPSRDGPTDWEVVRLGEDLEEAWRRAIPPDDQPWTQYGLHARPGLPPGVDFAVTDNRGDEWHVRTDGLAARRERSPTGWCAATRRTAQPALDGRTVKVTVHEQGGTPLRTVEVAEVSTGWFTASPWLGAGGHLVAAVREVEHPVWGWPPPGPERRYLGTWYVHPDGAKRKLDVPPPLSAAVWPDGTYALLAGTADGFTLQAYDAMHRPTWRRTYPRAAPAGQPVLDVRLVQDAEGNVDVQAWDGDRSRLVERLDASGDRLEDGPGQ